MVVDTCNVKSVSNIGCKNNYTIKTMEEKEGEAEERPQKIRESVSFHSF